jgi:hypothetical protein
MKIIGPRGNTIETNRIEINMARATRRLFTGENRFYGIAKWWTILDKSD